MEITPDLTPMSFLRFKIAYLQNPNDTELEDKTLYSQYVSMLETYKMPFKAYMEILYLEDSITEDMMNSFESRYMGDDIADDYCFVEYHLNQYDSNIPKWIAIDIDHTFKILWSSGNYESVYCEGDKYYFNMDA